MSLVPMFKTWDDVLQYWSENNITPVRRRVICAAVKTKDGNHVCAPRHHHILNDERFDVDFKEQGFVDQFNIFMDRKEACEVAKQNGIKPSLENTLFSEDLY